MPILRFIASLCLIFGVTWGAAAQDKLLNFFRLDESDLVPRADSGNYEVLAASKTLKNVDDLPVTVFVITRDEIISNGYTTLVDALSSIPGIRVSQPGSAMDGEAFQIRGIYGNYYCKILVDGITIKPTVVSGMPIGRQLPIRQAERIEVIFGPASSVYGAEALAGVINIVTHQSDRPVTAQADIALGTIGYEYLNVTIGGKVGKNKNVFTYSLFGGNSSQRDLHIKYDRDYLYNPSLYDSSYSYLDNPYYDGDSNSIDMGRLPTSSNLLGLSFHWRGWSAQAMRMSRSAHSSIDRDPSQFSYSDPLNFWAETIQRYTLRYEKKWNRVTSESHFMWLNYRLGNSSSFGMAGPSGTSGKAYIYSASDDIHLEEQLTITPARNLELVTGVMYEYSGNLPLTNILDDPFDPEGYQPFSVNPPADTSIFGGFGYNPIHFHRAGIYLQFFWQVGRFTLFGGFRTDYHSLFGDAHDPRIALLYKTKKGLSLRASFSTGYRVPSAYYMYNSEARRQDGGIYYSMVPNSALEPEKLIAAEAGIRWNRLDWLNLDASLFYHRIYEQFTRSFVLLDTALYPLAVNPAGLSQSYVNDENSFAELIGIQAHVRFPDLVPAIHLDADFDMTLSKGRENLPNDLGRIDDYRQMPVFMGQLNLSFSPVDRIRLQLKNNFATSWVRGYLPLDPDILREVGYPVDIDGFYTLDIKAAFIVGKNFEAFAHFNNVTNNQYGGLDVYSDQFDLFYNPQFGFHFRIGFNFRME